MVEGPHSYRSPAGVPKPASGLAGPRGSSTGPGHAERRPGRWRPTTSSRPKSLSSELVQGRPGVGVGLFVSATPRDPESILSEPGPDSALDFVRSETGGAEWCPVSG